MSVIDDPAAAEVSLDPMRRQILAGLVDPGSASTIAVWLGIPRQKVNYHLKVLEQHGLVELVEERRRGNFTERMLQATASSYVISPSTLGQIQPDPLQAPDRLSARWLLAVASRLVRDVGTLLTGAQRARRPLATFAMDGEIRFESAADRAAFAEELSAAVTELVGKYHGEREPGSVTQGKLNRLVIALHPAVPADAQGETGAPAPIRGLTPCSPTPPGDDPAQADPERADPAQTDH